MVTVTMDQLIDFRNGIDFLSDSEIPLKGAYKINKIKKAIAKESEFYVEKFQEIINTYAETDENGNIVYSNDKSQIMIKDDMIDECNKALKELQELEVQVENYNLTIDDLGEDLECTPDELEVLMPFMD
jgi:hypothetical protein